MILFKPVAIASLVCGILIHSVYAADQFSIGSAVDYSQGNYGATKATDVTATTLQAKYTIDDFSLQLNLPYLTLSGPSNIATTADTVLVVPTTNTQHRESAGIGDVLLGVIYNAIYDADTGIAIDVGFKLKMPTGDRRAGLGTGEADESMQLYGYKCLSDFTFMLAAGYKWVGQPVGMHYRNTLSASGGIIYQLSAQSSIGTLVDLRQSMFANLDDQIEVTVYGAYKLSSAWRAQLYVYEGQTQTSPSIGLGSMLSYRF